MSSLLRRASDKVDVRFVLELRRVRDAGNATRPLLLKWKRGDKSSGATKPAVVAGGEAIFKETITFECTMEQIFEEKYLSITLLELAEKGSKGGKLGKAIINLADYCKDGLNDVKEIPLGRRVAVLMMALQCEWLRLNKKTIVKVAPSAPQPSGLAAVSVGSEQLFLANTDTSISMSESSQSHTESDVSEKGEKKAIPTAASSERLTQSDQPAHKPRERKEKERKEKKEKRDKKDKGANKEKKEKRDKEQKDKEYIAREKSLSDPYDMIPPPRKPSSSEAAPQPSDTVPPPPPSQPVLAVTVDSLDATRRKSQGLEAEIKALSTQLHEGRWNVELLDRKCTTQEIALNRFQQLMVSKEEEITRLKQDTEKARSGEKEALAELDRTKQHLSAANARKLEAPAVKSSSSGGSEADALRKELEQLREAYKLSKAKEEAAIARAARVANELADKMAQLERQESSRNAKEREIKPQSETIRVSTTVLAKVQAELREENESLRRQDITKLREMYAKKDPRGSLRPGAPEHATIAELRSAKEELGGKIADLRERLEATAVLLSEAEAENERVRVELRSARADLSESNAAVAETSQSSMQARVEKAEQDRQTLSLVERHVYVAPQTFQSFEGLMLSRIAVECVHMLQDADVFGRNDTKLFSRTFDAMQALSVRPPDSLSSTAFWLSTACGAAHLLRLRNLSTFDPRSQGIHTGEISDEGSPFSRKLKIVSYSSYAHLIRIVCNKLEAILLPSLHNHEYWTDAPKKPAARDSNASASMTEILTSFTALLQAEIQANLFVSVVAQSFAQIFYFINSSIFNSLIRNRELCVGRYAFQIKMALSQLEQWVAQSHRLNEHHGNITAQLAPVIAAADVLIMDKGNLEYLRLFDSAETIRKYFAPLNPAQLHRLLELFSPDRVSPNPVPAAMRTAAQRLYEKDPSEELELPTARLLSLDQIARH